MEKSLEFHQKLKIELAIPPLGIHPKKMKTEIQKGTCKKKKKAKKPNMHLNIHTSIIYDSQDMEVT